MDHTRQAQAEHKNTIAEDEPGLVGITTEPTVAIGQAHGLSYRRAEMYYGSASVIDDTTIEAIRKLGGISAIAISHPHFYSSMVEWSKAFDNAPIYIHESNRPWVMRPDPAINFWSSEQYKLAEGLALVRCGDIFQAQAYCTGPAGPMVVVCCLRGTQYRWCPTAGM